MNIVNSLRYQPDGILTCVTTLGIKPSGKPDFTVITLPQPGAAAAVMSQSRCPSYAVLRNRECMADGTLQAIAVGSGNANVFTPNGGQAITPDLQALYLALRRDKVMAIHVTLGAGGYLGRAWGCDLSADYVQLNASA